MNSEGTSQKRAALDDDKPYQRKKTNTVQQFILKANTLAMAAQSEKPPAQLLQQQPQEPAKQSVNHSAKPLAEKKPAPRNKKDKIVQHFMASQSAKPPAQLPQKQPKETEVVLVKPRAVVENDVDKQKRKEELEAKFHGLVEAKISED